MGLCACVYARVGKEECAQGKNKRERERGWGENKFKGTGNKVRNPWAMTVSFQSGNGAGISSAFKISMSVYRHKNEQSNGSPVGCGWKPLRGSPAIIP